MSLTYTLEADDSGLFALPSRVPEQLTRAIAEPAWAAFVSQVNTRFAGERDQIALHTRKFLPVQIFFGVIMASAFVFFPTWIILGIRSGAAANDKLMVGLSVALMVAVLGCAATQCVIGQFTTVVKEESTQEFSNASQKMKVASPHVSMYITRLEELVGVTRFGRGRYKDVIHLEVVATRGLEQTARMSTHGVAASASHRAAAGAAASPMALRRPTAEKHGANPLLGSGVEAGAIEMAARTQS